MPLTPTQRRTLATLAIGPLNTWPSQRALERRGLASVVVGPTWRLWTITEAGKAKLKA